MQVKELKLIIRTEYLNSVKAKSFWITTLVMPVVFAMFTVVVSFLMEDSDALRSFGESTQAVDASDLSARQVFGMLVGMFLTLFLMTFGAQIFNKVKMEKSNRIIEILATSVEGRTMMLGKIVSVGLVGVTMLLIWGVLISIILGGIILVFVPDLPLDIFANPRLWLGLFWSLAFFIGGYVFFGSMYAACGAMSDKNNENQEYMTILTFVLLASFYLGQYAVDNIGKGMVDWLCYIPFTSPTVGAVSAVVGQLPLWQSLAQLAVLYFFAWIALIISGKIYRSSMLLMGKKFSPKDIVTFLKSK